MAASPTTAEKGPDDVRSRALAVREQMVASGTNVSQWARDRGFSPELTRQVLGGHRACRYGESHRIAVALGIKADVAAPGADRRRTNAEDLAVAP